MNKSVLRISFTMVCACFLLAAVTVWAEDKSVPGEVATHQPLTDIFRETTLCGGPVPEIEELENKIRKIPDTLSGTSQVQRLFEILGQFLSEQKMPVIGGCHPGHVDWAIDPAKLVGLAAGNETAIVLMEDLVPKIEVSVNELARWHYFLASLTQFDSPRGNSHLHRSYELYSRWYSEWTGDEDDPIYQRVLQLKGVKRVERIVLITTEDHCGYGTEFSITPNRISSKQEIWLRNLLSLAFSCCDDELADQLPLDHLKGMARDARFKSWAGMEIIKIVDSMLKNHDRVTKAIFSDARDEDFKSPLFRTYEQNQERLRKLILKRYKLQKRSIMGGNC